MVELIKAAEEGVDEVKLELVRPLEISDKEMIEWYKEFSEQEGLKFDSKNTLKAIERSSGDECDGIYDVPVTVLVVSLSE